MLANGAKLSYDKTNKGTTFTDLPGLKKIPDMGIEKEKVENSSLDDTVKVGTTSRKSTSQTEISLLIQLLFT